MREGSKNYRTCMNLDSITPRGTRVQSNTLRVCRPQYRVEIVSAEGAPHRVPFSYRNLSGQSAMGIKRPTYRSKFHQNFPMEQRYAGDIARINASHGYRPEVAVGTPVSTSDACGLRIRENAVWKLGYALRSQQRRYSNVSALSLQ